MPFKRSPMRYAHIIGYTTVIYQDDGNCIISVGYDGDFRIWHGIGDDDPPTVCVGEHVWTALQYGERVLVATDLNTVQAYKYPSLDKDGIEFRFTAYVTCLAKNKRFIAAGSEDATIKVLSLDNGEQFELENLGGPVLSMDMSKRDLLAASIGDGKIHVWDMKTKALKKTVDGLPKVKSFEAVLHFASPSFEPTKGALLAYPNGNEVIVMNTTSWEVVKKYVHPKPSKKLTVCGFSPMGDYIATGSVSGDVCIWDCETGKIVEGDDQYEANPITKLVWNPKNNGELAISDANGQVGTVMDIFVESDADDLDGGDIVVMAEKEGEEEEEGEFDDIFDARKDDDGKNFQRKYDSWVFFFLFLDTKKDEKDNDNEGLDNAASERAESDNDEMNENCIELEKLKSQIMGSTQKSGEMMPQSDAEDDDDDDDRGTLHSERVMVPKSYPQQPPFQPGSTPYTLEHCYLVYNHVGIVRRHATGQENSIEVEFHDSQVHHGIHLNNFLNHTMAGLSESVLAMACPNVDGNASKVVCINQAAFGKREWTYTMPGCEEIIAVTASDKIVVVATDSRLLRVFTARGTQREVISVAGPIVALAAYGDHFLVAYHSAPANEDQHISLMIVTCVNFKLRCREVRVPLSAGSELRWLGYSDRGSPVVYDTAGRLTIYHATLNLWFPIYNDENLSAKGASDHLFIIKVSESTQQVQLVVCRGSKYPLTTPRPVPMEVKFTLPMCDLDSEKESHEDELVRSLYLKANDADKLMKETAVKLFALACKNECEQRAKELVETIASSQLVPLVIKYASKIRRYHLADSLAPLLPTFQEQEMQEEKLEQESVRENAAIANELQHINLEAITKRDTTPKIKPLPVGTKKPNNPFRKSTAAGSSDGGGISSPASSTGHNVGTNGSSNPLEHLTGKAIGFSAARNSSPSFGSKSLTSNGGQDENRPQNSTTTTPASGMKFLPWFELKREELQRQHPEAAEADLIKIGMREFKSQQSKGQQSSTSTAESAGTPKRKLEENDQPEAGVSKLAKFGFVKNG
ncbi:WD repeat and HMG-box DNA-binding protein 1 [Anopheles maculipalpis]|uniref:WD repeat and HMG-box DNA-binding protein 1 n=1 Tax=Anopheles maculipalpis TaxID=1496333 RepID=UPI002158C6FB|nr:WD repeat and HMG-box DNA-binding protein 1 [Anopheles maculipalpis]